MAHRAEQTPPVDYEMPLRYCKSVIAINERVTLHSERLCINDQRRFQ
jgi:hypothetical protein